jgi:hypothetical protein
MELRERKLPRENSYYLDCVSRVFVKVLIELQFKLVRLGRLLDGGHTA